jgi:hypothetical protein
MPAYVFTSTFALRSDAAAAYRALLRPLPWLQRMPYTVEARQIVTGGPDGIGDRFRGTVRAPLPYHLSWEMETIATTPERAIFWRAWGDLEGTASWTVLHDDGDVSSRLVWDVRTNKAWMAAVGPLVSPALVWGHDRVMRAGVRALADHLDAELLAYDGTARRHDGG